jgi:hypothetical protein
MHTKKPQNIHKMLIFFETGSHYIAKVGLELTGKNVYTTTPSLILLNEEIT